MRSSLATYPITQPRSGRGTTEAKQEGATGLVASAVVAALLAVPASASADVNSEVNGGVLTVNSTANDAITITSVGGDVKVNGGNPGGGSLRSTARTSRRST